MTSPLIESKYLNRKIFYLKEIIESSYFDGKSEDNKFLMETMINASEEEVTDVSIKLSHAILDVKDVLFPPLVESLLYEWIDYHDLVVVDTTEEEINTTLTLRAGQYKPDNTKAKTSVSIPLKQGQPIMFRHLALMERRKMAERRRATLNFQLFQHEVDGVERFTHESSKEVLSVLKQIQAQSQNPNERVYVNPSSVNVKDEKTLKEVSMLLLRLYRNIAIDNSVSNSLAVVESIIPTMGQLCFDYRNVVNTIIDIKTKLKVGTVLPIIYLQKLYIVKVIENDPIPAELNLETITEEELRSLLSVTVRDVLITDEGNSLSIDKDDKELLGNTTLNQIKKNTENVYINRPLMQNPQTKEYEIKLNAINFSRREAIFLPPAMGGITLSNGELDITAMPTIEELNRNFRENIIDNPNKAWLDPESLTYLNRKEDIQAGENLIEICREQERLYAERRGEKKEFIDLLAVFHANSKPRKRGV